MILTFIALEKDAGRKVYSVLRNHFGASATLIRRLKNADAIKIDGQTAFTDRLLRPGDKLTVDISLAEPECDVVPEDGEIDILYEDEGLIAVNKPAGILVHPSHSRYLGTLANYVGGYLQRTYSDGRNHSVGRLDRDTSGVVLFAKNSYTKFLAGEAVKDGAKYYNALVLGRPETDCGIIEMPIKRAADGDMLRIVAPDGQYAATKYNIVKCGTLFGRTVSLLQLELITGRTHQIRVHCSSLGMPLLGDVLYNTPESIELSQKLNIHAQALHASSLSFVEPISKNPLTINAPILREDMKNIIAMI